MKNIVEILKGLGIEVPEDKQEDLNRQVLDNYKTVSEFEKKLGKVEGERDNWKTRAETAEQTLKAFDGADPATIKADLAKYKKQAEDAETNFKQQLEQRDFDDALKTALGEVKFSSEAAKKAIVAEIRDAGLKLVDGKIVGLSDLLAQIKEKDASAFEEDNGGEGRARFTKPADPKGGDPKPGTARTANDIASQYFQGMYGKVKEGE